MTGYKTMIVAALVAMVGALQGLDWLSLLPSGTEAVGWVTTGLAVVMMVLRALTTTPVGKSS